MTGSQLLHLPTHHSYAMAEFSVSNIEDYNKIKTQTWILGEGESQKSGNFVVIRGIPDLSGDKFLRERAIARLSITLLNKSVVLKAASVISPDTIECDVFVDGGVNVVSYFSDFLKPL